ncbi:beta-ketoacyl reductase, partial [Streptomyces sp. ADMS]|uniref:beta-ketoacyl reductase n=1 Tax=Streptomyces sp. ADMS TaxID=3071415 RepID=UPI00296FB796
ARTRHWLDEHPTAPPTPDRAAPRKREDIKDWFYEPSWQRVALPTGAEAGFSGHWLVFADALGAGEALANRLRSAGADVIVAEPGAPLAQVSQGQDVITRLRVDPASSADYDLLVGHLRERTGDEAWQVVHCWGISDDRTVDVTADETALRLGFDSLIRLVQAIDRSAVSPPSRIWVLNNGIHNVTGTEHLSPAKATVLGPCRVLPRELPGVKCHNIDLDIVAAPTPRQLDYIMAELARETVQETETIAHRGPHRWVQHYLPQSLPDHDETRSPLREDGVYLITGGTGGLGLELAAHLTARGARVLLTSRTPLPPPNTWDDHLADGRAEPRTRDIVRRLCRLRDAGAQLLVAQADVSDRKQMADAVEQAVRRWGAVHGVFHAAGIAGGGLIQLKDLRRAAEVLRPKVRGTLVLEDVLADQHLDFTVLFGANSANVGHFGQVDYCAANCFLDAFAQDRSRSRRVVTIDWGTWKDVGMAVTTAPSAGMSQTGREEIDERGMSSEEGLRALDRILTRATNPQVIVSPVDLADVFAHAFRLEATESSPLPQRLTVPHGETALTHPADPPRDVPADQAARVICGVWQELLGVEHIDTEDSFFDLGGNSLIAIQVVSALNERLGTQLMLSDLYEALTAERLAELVDRSAPEVPASSLRPTDERRKNMQKRRQQQRAARGQR